MLFSLVEVKRMKKRKAFEKSQTNVWFGPNNRERVAHERIKACPLCYEYITIFSVSFI